MRDAPVRWVLGLRTWLGGATGAEAVLRKATQLDVQRLLGFPHRGSVARLTESGPGVVWGRRSQPARSPTRCCRAGHGRAAAGTPGAGRRLGDNARTASAALAMAASASGTNTRSSDGIDGHPGRRSKASTTVSPTRISPWPMVPSSTATLAKLDAAEGARDEVEQAQVVGHHPRCDAGVATRA